MSLSQSYDMFMSFLQVVYPMLLCLAELLSTIADLGREETLCDLSCNKNRIEHPIDPYQMLLYIYLNANNIVYEYQI